MDNHTAEQRRKNMRAIKNKDTRIEVLLRKELWRRGLRYRKNPKSVFGKPDIVFQSLKIAVFCDSEFWHGYAWSATQDDIKTRRDFWIPKIEKISVGIYKSLPNFALKGGRYNDFGGGKYSKIRLDVPIS